MVQETMMKMGKKVKEIILEEQVNVGTCAPMQVDPTGE
jgi:hypothetical protein